MEKTGKLSPTLFIHGVDGNAVLQPKELENIGSKDELVQVARIVCIAHGADATVSFPKHGPSSPNRTRNWI